MKRFSGQDVGHIEGGMFMRQISKIIALSVSGQNDVDLCIVAIPIIWWVILWRENVR